MCNRIGLRCAHCVQIAQKSLLSLWLAHRVTIIIAECVCLPGGNIQLSRCFKACKVVLEIMVIFIHAHIMHFPEGHRPEVLETQDPLLIAAAP